mmetsp:Transcript_19045/g.31202  ORF Transcript_19045/g.31202 Transcript_19045/m.31202 type:complete len:622 (+) Transcript_19045:59-1924(+)
METTVAPIAPLSVDVLDLVKASQAQNGLRHSDYKRYRQYCSRRLRRIRASLHLPQGKGRFLKKIAALDAVSENRHLLIPLTQAERAWAHAMDLKQLQSVAGANMSDMIRRRRRFHILRKLSKAAKHALELEELSAKRGDARTALDAQAYSATMSGDMLLEREKWKEARHLFLRARAIYLQLGQVGDASQQRLYQDRVEKLDTSIRYCKYNLERSGAEEEDIDMDASKEGGEIYFKAMQRKLEDGGEIDLVLQSKLENVIEESRKKQAETIQDVTWRGTKVPVRNDQVRVCLVSTNDYETELQREEKQERKLAVYDLMFIQLEDAKKHIRNDLLRLASSSVEAVARPVEQQNASAAALNSLLAYVNELLIRKTIDRNMLLIKEQESKLLRQAESGQSKKAARPDDLIRLYETVLQNVNELRNIPGFEKDPAFKMEVTTKSLLFRALRCFYMGEAYAGAEKWSEAVVLYDLAKQHATTCNTNLKENVFVDQSLSDRATKLINTVKAQRCLSHAQAVLGIDVELLKTVDSKVEGISLKGDQSKGLLPVINSYDSGAAIIESFFSSSSAEKESAKLVEFPPALEPVPCKPILFDLAYDYIEYPTTEIASRVAKKGSGWLSWLRKK